MTIAEAKNIDINDLLERLGHRPTKHTSKDTWYSRPYGNERHASFHVSRDGRAWFDHGIGQGGSIIDLALKLANTDSVAQALSLIEKAVGSTGNTPPTLERQPIVTESSFIIEATRQMADTRGQQWCQSRRLDPHILAPYLSDVYFNRAVNPKLKPYYGVGLANIAGGFEIRTQFEGAMWVKSCIGQKAPTVFQSDRQAAPWFSFEGLPDFGTFLSEDKPPINAYHYLILNGTGQTAKAIDFLKTQPSGHLIVCSQAGQGGQQSKADLLQFSEATNWTSGIIDYRWAGYADYNESYMAQQGLLNSPPVKAGLKTSPRLE